MSKTRATEAATADAKRSEVVTLPNQMQAQKPGLLARMAERYGLEPQTFERTVFATAMPANASREEFIACLMIAHEHGLNPLVKEIYFMRTRSGQIQPIVGVDGWISKAHRHPHFKGCTFNDIRDAQGNLTAIECTLHRSDMAVPVTVTEYMAECKGDSPAWKKTPARMLRHRALTQAVRYGVGFAGVMDRDEFDQWQGPHGGQLRDVGPVLPGPAPANAAPMTHDLDVEPADADAFDVDGLLARLKAALDKCATSSELVAAWRPFDAEIEGPMPVDQRPRAYELYDAAEARIEKALA